MSKIIELSTGTIAGVQPLYPEEDIELVNPYEYMTTKLPFEDGAIDGIFANWILNHVPYGLAANVVVDWARCLSPTGLLHITIPSLEWLARSVLQEDLQPHIRPLLWGLQTDQYHIGLNGLRMKDLRGLLEFAKLRAVKARVSKVSVEVGDTIYDAEQHYVVGQKDL